MRAPSATKRSRSDELQQRDFAADDQVGATDVQVVAAAAREIFDLMAGLVLAEVELEAGAIRPSIISLSNSTDSRRQLWLLRAS